MMRKEIKRRAQQKKRHITYLLLNLFLISFNVPGDAAAWTISGTVYGNGTPMPDATVNLYFASNGAIAGQATTAANGGFSLSVADGSYNMLVEPPDDLSGYANSPINGIEVAGNDVSQDVLLVTSGNLLSGVVRLPDGTLVQGVRVFLYEQDSSALVGEMTTGSDGVYAFSVIPGSYKYRLFGTTSSGMNFPGSPSFLRIGGAINGAYQNTVVSGATTQDSTLPLAWLSGQTTDSNGSPVGDVELQTIHSETVNGTSYYIEHLSGQTKSNAEGQYSMALLDDFSYQITAIPPIDSGFSSTVVDDMDIVGPSLFGVILQLPDLISPLILSGPYVDEVTDQTALVQWSTDEPSTSAVRVNGITYAVSGYRREHAVPVTGLVASTVYTAEVQSADEAGNGPVTASVEFETGVAPDLAAPLIIEGPVILSIAHDSAVVEWRTNEPATTDLDYGPGGDLSVGSTVPGLRDLHRVELTGLSAEVFYSVQVRSSDAAENGPVTSSVVNFSTLPTPDTTPPVITAGPLVINISETETTVIWSTDEPAVSGVSLNDGTAYKVIRDENLVTEHEVRITGLAPDTAYDYTVSSTDGLGNGPTLSETQDFETLSEAVLN